MITILATKVVVIKKYLVLSKNKQISSKPTLFPWDSSFLK
jgi:hypothetical protein